MNRLQNRIIKSGEESVKDLVPNSANWRLHPVRQKAATKEAIAHVGWVERVLVNLRTGDDWPDDQRGVKTLVDGYMRLGIALDSGEETVPVDYVDLTPLEEAYVLATLDPLGALAQTDKDALVALTGQLDQTTKSVRAALRAAGIDSRNTLTMLADQNAQGDAGSALGGESGQGEGKSKVVEPGNGSKPPKQPEKYPLAIVLSRQDLTLWQAYKERVGIKADTPAFLDLLRAVVDERNPS